MRGGQVLGDIVVEVSFVVVGDGKELLAFGIFEPFERLVVVVVHCKQS